VRTTVQSWPVLDTVKGHLAQRARALAALGGARGLWQALTISLYSRQLQWITVKRLDAPDPALPPDPETECFVVDSLPAFDAVAPEIPPAFRDSVKALEARVARGCVVCLARRPRKDGGGQVVVGYEIAERGIFSALGRRKALGGDVVFSHYAEVLPTYRGQRIHRRLFAARDEYFRQRGGKILCGVVAPHNRASLHALARAGHQVVGTVARVSVLRVVVVWQTPWERITRALQSILP